MFWCFQSPRNGLFYMKYKETIYSLKSGEQVTIRVPELSDTQAVLDLKRNYIKNTSTLPFTLEEYPNDLEKESALIESYEKSENSIFLIAEINGEFIGNIDLTGSKRSKMNHTGMIGMGINEQWRNQGLGSILIQSVINWAKTKSAIQIIWLDVYATNEIGYSLYKKMGFQVSGIIKGFFREGDTYIDKIQMYQHIR